MSAFFAVLYFSPFCTIRIYALSIAVLTAVVSRNCMKNAIATIKDTVRDLWCFSCIVVISFAPIKKTCAK